MMPHRVVMAAYVAAVLAGTCAASAQSVYNPGRVLKDNGNACLGMPACTIFPQSKVSVSPGGPGTTMQLQCPEDHPTLIGWDATRQEHISLHVMTFEDGKISLVVGNNGTVKGFARVSIGCSREAVRPTAYPEKLDSIPTNISH
jgi:hypothetical protein